MNVRIVGYRKAKELEGPCPRGKAFGYPKNSPVWHSWTRVVSVDADSSRIQVETINTPGEFYTLPVCCVRGKYAREALCQEEHA